MSEKLFKFLLSELKTVRLVCNNPRCGAVIELTVERMRAKCEFAQCFVCKEDFFGPHGSQLNPLTKLADAILEMQKHTKAIEIEFVMPEEQKQ